MTNDSLTRPRVRLAVGLSGAALVGLIAVASAKPEQPFGPGVNQQIAQPAEPSDPPAAKPRSRKPLPKAPAQPPAQAPAAQAPAQATTRADTPPTAAPPSPTVTPAVPAATAQPGPDTVMAPVRHARDAKLGRCLEAVTKASASTIDTAHAAVSTWSQRGADEHMFQSIVALRYGNAVAPKAASVLVASPEGAGCEATTVQVYPTTRSCGEVEADLRKSGRTLADLGGVPMTQEAGTSRHLLLPAPGTGCVVVAVGLALNP